MGLAWEMKEIKKDRKYFEICAKDYEKLSHFQEEHESCKKQFPNMTGAQYQYIFIEDGLGVFSQVKCCCGKHIDLDGDYDLQNSMPNPTFQIYADDQKTRKVVKQLFQIKKRPRMFMLEPSYTVLNAFLHGIAVGIHEWKECEEDIEVVCWSEIESYINEIMMPKESCKHYSDEELFYLFFEALEQVIREHFPQYVELIIE